MNILWSLRSLIQINGNNLTFYFKSYDLQEVASFFSEQYFMYVTQFSLEVTFITSVHYEQLTAVNWSPEFLGSTSF